MCLIQGQTEFSFYWIILSWPKTNYNIHFFSVVLREDGISHGCMISPCVGRVVDFTRRVSLSPPHYFFGRLCDPSSPIRMHPSWIRKIVEKREENGSIFLSWAVVLSLFHSLSDPNITGNYCLISLFISFPSPRELLSAMWGSVWRWGLWEAVSPISHGPSHSLSLVKVTNSPPPPGNYCPLCEAVYEDEDYETKMINCTSCDHWVHIEVIN